MQTLISAVRNNLTRELGVPEPVVARSTFYENLFIRQETVSVDCPHYLVSILRGLNLEKM